MKEHTDGQEEGLPPGQDGRREEAQVSASTDDSPRASPPARGSCLTCSAGTLRGATKDEKIGRAIREMARLGFVNCTRSPAAASFRPLESRCPSYTPVSPEAAAARQQWAENINRRTA